MSKVVVFDLGGTLMEFKGMPPIWVDYYKIGFENINKEFNLKLSEDKINKAVEIMKSYNPRINYRENEIDPKIIFAQATSDWNINIDINKIVECFFDGINLETVIYNYAFDMIEHYRNEGYYIACLTDLPSGMPDGVFKKPLQKLIDKLDLYVSSQSCGYRKPDKFGLDYIAKHFDIDVADLFFIGDEEKDRKAAENAGCKFIFIEELLNEYN